MWMLPLYLHVNQKYDDDDDDDLVWSFVAAERMMCFSVPLRSLSQFWDIFFLNLYEGMRPKQARLAQKTGTVLHMSSLLSMVILCSLLLN